MIANKSIRLLMNECELYDLSSSGKKTLNICELAGNLAYHAMMLEAHLTPKAGLVDCVSTGAHADMDISTFITSSDALRPYMKAFVRAGYENHHLQASDLLPKLRKVGIEAEQAMFDATNNINTHKGMIFTLGLICGAVGWLYKKSKPFNAKNIRSVITESCSSLVVNELHRTRLHPETAGEKIFQKYGLTGIRGEAVNGYPTIFNHGLPAYQAAIENGQSEEQALSQTLLVLMANNSDTNIVNRGGLEGLTYVQVCAKYILMRSPSTSINFEKEVNKFDQQLIQRNLSPGGSADLLAATWLFSQLNLCNNS